MKRSAAIFLLGSASIGGVAALFSCINEHVRPVSDAAPPVGVVECDSGGPGNFPPANCDPSDNSCPNVGTCPIDNQKCGDPTTCMPLADNSKKTVYDFRLRRLLITSPPSLVGTAIATGLVQTSVIDKGVDLAAPECGDNGTGAFNWLLRVDPTGDTITTGGAPPSPDPFTTGYCFYRHLLGSLDVEPAQTGITFDDAGSTFSTSAISLLNVPVFLSPDAGAADPKNVIILPLRNAVLKNATLSASDNCIGQFNQKALSSTCAVDLSSCSKWDTAGSLGAAMTLEDADKVPLTVLPVTLCVLLTGTTADPNTHGCPRDGNGNIIAKGDYCSTTNSAGGCQDSFWLSATFAASAVTINDGSAEPTCQGSSDAGADAAPSDAGDAAAD